LKSRDRSVSDEESTDESTDEDERAATKTRLDPTGDDPYVLARTLLRRGERGGKLQEAVRRLVKASRVEEAQTIFILARKTALADAGMDFDAVQAQDDFLAALKRLQHPESVRKQKHTVAPVRASVPAPVRDQPVAREAGRLRASFAPTAEHRPRRPALRLPGSLVPSPEPRPSASSQSLPYRSPQAGGAGATGAAAADSPTTVVNRSPLELMAMMTDENGVLQVPPPPRDLKP
jgi:hypothetical protein